MSDNNLIDAEKHSALPETPPAPTDAGQIVLPDDVAEETTEAPLRALHDDPEIAAFLATMCQELPPFWIHLPREQMLGYGGIDDEWVPMCGPLRVEALTRDGSGRNWSRRIRFLDRDGCLRRETIPEADILEKPRSVCAQLISAGLAIEGNRHDIIDLIRRWPVEARILSVSRPGWMAGTDAEPAYLLSDGRLLSADPQPDDQIELVHARAAVPPSGSLDGWKDTVGCMAVDNPALICAISAVLAGPLLKHAGIETLGVNFHAPTSFGKTTALSLAQSCMGPPDLDRWNATNTALELVCRRAHDGVLMLDEFLPCLAKMQGMMDWDDLRFLLAQERTLSGAGQRLGVSASTVSRRIAALEATLGLKLFRPHRDGYDLTDAGRGLVPAAEDAGARMAVFERHARESTDALAGPVRIEAPELLDHAVLLPAITG